MVFEVSDPAMQWSQTFPRGLSFLPRHSPLQKSSTPNFSVSLNSSLAITRRQIFVCRLPGQRKYLDSPLSTSGHISSESCCHDCLAFSSLCGARSHVFSSLCVAGRGWLRDVVELGRHAFFSLCGRVFFTSPSPDFLMSKTRY